jgi:hypothetical protein
MHGIQALVARIDAETFPTLRIMFRQLVAKIGR